MLGARCWVLVPWCWVLGAGCWVLVACCTVPGYLLHYCFYLVTFVFCHYPAPCALRPASCALRRASCVVCPLSVFKHNSLSATRISQECCRVVPDRQDSCDPAATPQYRNDLCPICATCLNNRIAPLNEYRLPSGPARKNIPLH